MRKTKLIDRGIKTANYYVLSQTLMPAILVETAFIDTQGDADILGSDDGRQKIAKGIAKGILNYFGIEYSEGEETDMAETVYNYTLEVPEWGRPTVQKLLDKGFIKGDEEGKLGINETLLKALVINDRAGLY